MAGLLEKFKRPFMKTSKDVKMKPAPAGADYDTLIAHHTDERLAHAKQTTGYFRTNSNIDGHMSLIYEHKREAERLEYLKENDDKKKRHQNKQ